MNAKGELNAMEQKPSAENNRILKKAKKAKHDDIQVGSAGQ